MSAGLQALLEPFADEVVLVPRTSSSIDVVLVDVGHEGQVARMIDAAAEHGAPVLALVPLGDLRGAENAVRAGAVGSVWYSVGVTALVDAVQRAAAGHPVDASGLPSDSTWQPGHGLSEREVQVLGLVASGLSNTEISAVLYLSINTVKTYIRTAYRKIGVTTRSQAVGWSIRNGHTSRIPIPDTAPRVAASVGALPS